MTLARPIISEVDWDVLIICHRRVLKSTLTCITWVSTIVSTTHRMSKGGSQSWSRNLLHQRHSLLFAVLDDSDIWDVGLVIHHVSWTSWSLRSSVHTRYHLQLSQPTWISSSVSSLARHSSAGFLQSCWLATTRLNWFGVHRGKTSWGNGVGNIWGTACWFQRP